MLQVQDITAGYGATRVLHGLSFHAAPGEVLCLMGRNGAGKSTALKAIMGLVRVTSGRVTLDGTRLDTLPAHRVPGRGIGYVPQGRRLFADLTVAENLAIALPRDPRAAAIRARILVMFPRLAERLDQVAGTLSGGEQQMLAIARALCLEPGVVLLDEPTEGLQPSIAAGIRDTIRALKAAGTAVVLVEHNVETARAVADRIVFVVNGRDAETRAAAELAPDDAAFRRHVGV